MPALNPCWQSVSRFFFFKKCNNTGSNKLFKNFSECWKCWKRSVIFYVRSIVRFKYWKNFDFFTAFGTMPFIIDRFTMCVNEMAILLVVVFKNNWGNVIISRGIKFECLTTFYNFQVCNRMQIHILLLVLLLSESVHLLYLEWCCSLVSDQLSSSETWSCLG